MKFLWIAAGGAAGAILRYLVGGWGQSLTRGEFPLGTLVVNVLGCFAIGVCAAVLVGPVLVREEFRFAVMIGLLGAFTTFSTFGLETYALASDGQRLLALLNVALSNVVGLVAVWIGFKLAQRWYGV